MSLELLIKSDTTNGSTTFSDSSANDQTITNSGCSHSTSYAKWGASSINSAAGDYLTTDPFVFGEDDFVVDFWWYPTDDDSIPVSQGTGTMDTTFRTLYSSDGYFYLWYNNGESEQEYSFAHTGVITQDQWNHLALVRDSTYLYFYVNGVEKLSMSVGSIWINSTSSGYFCIGRGPTTTPGALGYIDEVRVLLDESIDFSVTGVPTGETVIPTNNVEITIPAITSLLEETPEYIETTIPAIESYMSGGGELYTTIPDAIESSFDGPGFITSGDLITVLPSIQSLTKVPTTLYNVLLPIESSLGSGGELHIEVASIESSFRGGVVGSISATLSSITSALFSAADLDADLPSIESVFTGTADQLGSCDISIPSVESLFAGDAELVGQLETSLPLCRSLISGDVGYLGSFNMILPSIESSFGPSDDVSGDFFINIPEILSSFYGTTDKDSYGILRHQRGVIR